VLQSPRAHPNCGWGRSETRRFWFGRKSRNVHDSRAAITSPRSAINRIAAPSSGSSVAPSAARRSIAIRIAAIDPGMSPRSRHASASRKLSRAPAIAGLARSPITTSSSPRFCASRVNGSSGESLSATSELSHPHNSRCKRDASLRRAMTKWRNRRSISTATRRRPSAP
jgi:hypothetical protein